MSQITKVEFWKDTGFQEGAVEVPSINDVLPTADETFEESIKTSTEDFFSAFTIPVVFSEYLNMSYVRITYEYNNSDDPMVFCGWIDDIALKSDTVDNPSTVINWHIDYWRTYFANATFGYGLVRSRPSSENDPPQSLSYRYRMMADTYNELIPTSIRGTDCYWGIVSCAIETADNKIVETHTVIVPVARQGTVYYKLGANTTARESLSMSEWVSGKFDEILGLSPSSISSVFVSPLPPHKVLSGDGSAGNPYVMSGSEETTTEPHTDTKTSPNSDRALVGFADDFRNLRLEDGSKQSNLSGVYTVSAVDGVICGLQIDGQPGGISESPTDYYSVISIDQLVKITFGDEYVSQPGDKVSISGSFTAVYEQYSGTYTRSAMPGGSLMRIISLSLADSTSKREFTRYSNANTFGNYYVLIHGRTNGVALTLTSHTVVISSTDFKEVKGDKYGFYRNDGRMDEYRLSMPNEASTSDTEEVIITDMESRPVATLPWGMKVQNYSIRNVVSSVSAYVQIRFDKLSSASEGLEVTIPLPSVDLASNSYSEYNFSGQREYDISQRKIASQQALVSGITSSITGATSNAIMANIGVSSKGDVNEFKNNMASYLIEAVQGVKLYGNKTQQATARYNVTDAVLGANLKSAGSVPTGFGVARAGGATIGLGIATSLAEYGASQYFNGKLQKAEDMLQAKQIDSILTNGAGWDFLYHGSSIRMTSLKPDEYSMKRFEADKTLNGIYCSEPTENCTELISAGGPLQIDELIVGGDMPVQARAYIRGRFANGVRIKTINTQNVTEGE